MNNTEPARLNFRPAELTSLQAAEGATVYEAEAEGVTYRIIGTIVDPIAGNGRRTFRAYRVVGTNGHSLYPAGRGASEKLLRLAKEEAERDLVEVLRDRRAQDVAARIETRVDAGVSACPAGTACTGAAYPGHPAHPVREIEWPTPICPDAEAGKPHAAHRIEGTWREHCPGVESAFTTAEEHVERRERHASEVLGLAGLTAATHMVKFGGTIVPREGIPCAHPESARVRSRDVWHPDTCGGCGEAIPDADRPQAPPASPWTEFHDKMQAAIRAADAAVQAAQHAQAVDPVTEDTVPELVDRIVRRAQYEALKMMRTVVAGWVEGADDGVSRPIFTPDDIANMINDAATVLRVPKLVETGSGDD